MFVRGVPQGVPIVYTIDGEFAIEMESSSLGSSGVAEQVMWRSIYTQLGESAEAIAQFDNIEAQHSSVYNVPWVEPGQTATASIDVIIDGEALTIECGESGTMSNSDLELECSVALVDGLPHLEVRNTPGLHVDIYRNGVVVPIYHGPLVDLDAELGVPLTYTAIVMRFSHSDLVAECGTVELNVDLPLASLLRLSQASAETGFGPHVYWRVTPVCDGCTTEPTTLYFATADDPAVPWELPTDHPGLVHPGRVHKMLIRAIDAGSDVEATLDERGNVVSYTIDGQGISSDCLVIATLPPELVATTRSPNTDSYCGYVHEH